MTIDEELDQLSSIFDDDNSTDSQKQEAFKRLSILAEQGHAAAQYYMGECYYCGAGVSEDLHKAFEWFQKSADQGDDYAQNRLGECYLDGEVVSRDYHKAFDMFSKAAEQGNADAQHNLGICFANGVGVEKDLSAAFEWYKKAAEQGNAEAQNNLGVCYSQGIGVEKDLSAAFEWYKKAAEQGNALAQHNLGVCYSRGTGVEKDLSAAFEWYKKAAEQGNAEAQNNLGVCYSQGVGVEKDLPTAFEWYKKAAKQGNALAQGNVGFCYYNQRGVERDDAAAVKWFKKAAKQGVATAINDLGVCYFSGRGVKQDYKKAWKLYKEAADLENADALYNLASCLFWGQGVERDRKACFEMMLKAASKGSTNAQCYVSRCYYHGSGVDKDIKKAIELASEAAEHGCAAAQIDMGNCCYSGDGVEQDYRKAVDWYRKAADQGNAYAQYRLGYCFEQGIGVEANPDKAFDFVKESAKNNFGEAIKKLQSYYATSTCVIENQEEGFKICFRPSSSDLFTKELSTSFKSGICVKSNRILSSFWKNKHSAANSTKTPDDILKQDIGRGDAEADYLLANTKSKIESDVSEAFDLLASAAEKGYGNAKFVQTLFDWNCRQKSELSQREKEIELSKAFRHPYLLEDIVFNLYGDNDNGRLLWAIMCLYSTHIGSKSYLVKNSDDSLQLQFTQYLEAVCPISDFNTEEVLFRLCHFYDRQDFENQYKTGLLKVLDRNKNNIENPTTYPNDRLLEHISRLLDMIDKSYPIGRVIDMYSSKGRLATMLNPKTEYIGYVANYEDSLIARLLFQAWDRPFSKVSIEVPEIHPSGNEAIVCLTPLRQYSYAPFDVQDIQLKIINNIVCTKEDGIAIILVDQDFCTAIETDMENCRTYLLERSLVEEVIELPCGTFGDVESRTALLVLNFDKDRKGSDSVLFSSIEADGFYVSSDKLKGNRYILDSLLYRQSEKRDEGEELHTMDDLADFHIKGFSSGPECFISLKKADFSNSLLNIVSHSISEIVRNEDEMVQCTKFRGPVMHITYENGIRLFFSRNEEEYSCHHNLGFAFRVNEKKVLPEYLAYVLVSNSNVHNFIKGIIDDYGKFPESEFMRMKIAINPNLAEQKTIVEDALMRERQSARSGLEYNLALASPKSATYTTTLNPSFAQNGLRITQCFTRKETFETEINVLLRKTQDVSSIDAIVIDTDMPEWEDLLRYQYECEKKSIPMYLIYKGLLTGLRGNEKKYFIEEGRAFNNEPHDFKDNLARKIRDDLDLGNSKTTKIRNQYIEVFNATDALDREYSDHSLNLSKSIMQFIYDGSRIDDSSESSICGCLRASIHKLLGIFKEKGMVPPINPGAIPTLLHNRRFDDKDETGLIYIQIDPIVPDYLSYALTFFCRITNQGTHGSQDSSNLGHAALRIAMEFVLWFHKEFKYLTDHEYWTDANRFVQPAKYSKLKVKVATVQNKDYYFAGNVHLENSDLFIKEGDEIIITSDRLKYDTRPFFDSDNKVVFYASSQNYQKVESR